MITLADARRFALGLPGTTEQDHFDMGSFRVRGKIFATVPDEVHVRIMVEEDQIRAVARAHPKACQEHYWGQRLACVVVDLRRASASLVEELLTDAWARKAPRKLVEEFEAARGR